MQRDFARVFQAMSGADRNVGGLVFRQHHFLVATADLSRALDDDPMLGAMMVHLQRQLTAGLYDDVLDLHPMAVVQRGEAAPRTMNSWQRVGLVAALLDQPRHQRFDLLGAFAWRHHNRVSGPDDD